MNIEEAYTLIPKSFKVVNHTVNVSIEDRVTVENEEVYGCWSAEKLEIKVALNIYETELQQEQILNTYMHELIHCFIFFLGMEQDEMLAQGMANLFREYEVSKSVQ
jgi:predicted Zn-dependent protease with MMP-like domain